VRIAHITDCYHPRVGGIELQVQGLARAQAAAGHHVEVITATPTDGPSDSAGSPDGDRGDDIPIHRLSVSLPFDLPVSPYVGDRLVALLRRRGIEVVHVHAGLVSAFAYPALRSAVRAGIPGLVTVHSLWRPWQPGFRLADLAVGWRDWPVAWTAVSPAAAGDVQRVLGDRALVEVLPNGVDTTWWRRHDTSRPPGEEVLIVAVQRLAARKRTVPLLRILDRTRRLVPRSVAIHAIIVGDGPHAPLAARRIRRLGLDWVTLAGRRSQPEIRALYEQADLFLAAAHLESFGIAALEARTAGLPVLAMTDAGIATFIRDGVEGLLAPDDHALARALARLIRDQGLRERIAAHNRTTGTDHDWPHVVAAADRHLHRALDLRRT